jgi:nitronate monooxygenase
MWRNRRLLDLLGLEHPIIQAPMAGSTTPAMAAAVANAGGLGSIGAATASLDEWRNTVAETKRLTNRAINVNFFVHEPPTPEPTREMRMAVRLEPYYAELGLEVPAPSVPFHPFNAAALSALVELRPRVASFHFGLPAAAAVKALKDAGIRVLSSATTPGEAKKLEAMGADAVIAQGWEAGGHRGTFAAPFAEGQIGTMALVPQVVDAVQIPVIAAGGIADGRGIAAALMLGASGVQIGTAFLTCAESAAHPLHREALLDRARPSQVTPLFGGRPARALVNRYMTEMADAEPLPFPMQFSLVTPLARAAVQAGSTDFLPMWAGQAHGLNRALPAAELMQRLVEEAAQRLASPAPGS